MGVSDHPRSRGVYLCQAHTRNWNAGSSPLARGLLGAVQGGAGRGRIIPARAGFTASTSPSPRRSSDHPRSRGVYGGFLLMSVASLGSSPLARGLRGQSWASATRRRIIPARAGFTAWSASPWVAPKDHPRSRGVYCDPRPRRRDVKGSSPLARGLHPYHYSGELRHGIIPARAGFTPPGTR